MSEVEPFCVELVGNLAESMNKSWRMNKIRRLIIFCSAAVLILAADSVHADIVINFDSLAD